MTLTGKTAKKTAAYHAYHIYLQALNWALFCTLFSSKASLAKTKDSASRHILIFYLIFMKTPKEAFWGSDSLDNNEGRWTGFKEMVQKEIADQVADVLRNM